MTSSPLAEEATRLLVAVQEWLAGTAEAVPLAAGDPECRVCPVCQALRMLRSTRPEVVEHVGAAGAELLAALRAALAGHDTHGGTPAGTARREAVQRIRVGD